MYKVPKKMIPVLCTAVMWLSMIWMLYGLLNNPPNNILSGVHCKVIQYHPAATYPVAKSGFVGSELRDQQVTVRFDDGSISTKTESSDACVIGQDAKATVRIGRITHKLISVVYVSCYQ